MVVAVGPDEQESLPHGTRAHKLPLNRECSERSWKAGLVTPPHHPPLNPPDDQYPDYGGDEDEGAVVAKCRDSGHDCA